MAEKKPHREALQGEEMVLAALRQIVEDLQGMNGDTWGMAYVDNAQIDLEIKGEMDRKRFFQYLDRLRHKDLFRGGRDDLYGWVKMPSEHKEEPPST